MKMVNERYYSVARETATKYATLLTQTLGTLQEYDENSFYQRNDDVTRAVYKCKGYGRRIAIWFDNKTRERIRRRQQMNKTRFLWCGYNPRGEMVTMVARLSTTALVMTEDKALIPVDLKDLYPVY